MPPYNWSAQGDVGASILDAAKTSFGSMTLIAPAFAALLVLAIVLLWKQLHRAERAAFIAIAAVAGLLSLSAWTSHSIIMIWLGD
jgi:hypothetical protein